MVVVVHTFDSPEKAHAFFGNAELKDAISRGGVDASSLQLEFLQEEAPGRL